VEVRKMTKRILNNWWLILLVLLIPQSAHAFSISLGIGTMGIAGFTDYYSDPLNPPKYAIEANTDELPSVGDSLAIGDSLSSAYAEPLLLKAKAVSDPATDDHDGSYARAYYLTTFSVVAPNLKSVNVGLNITLSGGMEASSGDEDLWRIWNTAEVGISDGIQDLVSWTYSESVGGKPGESSDNFYYNPVFIVSPYAFTATVGADYELWMNLSVETYLDEVEWDGSNNSYAGNMYDNPEWLRVDFGQPIPEPLTIILVGTGLSVMLPCIRRRICV
jgi:hypothetical protein